MEPMKYAIAAVVLAADEVRVTGTPAVAADLEQLKEQGFARIASRTSHHGQ